MATNSTDQTQSFDSKEITRQVARVKHELSGLIQDANRSRPFYASTKEKAAAKHDAAVKALGALAEKIDALKKDNS